MPVIFAIFQVLFLIFIIYILIKGMNPNKRDESTFKGTHLFFEVLLFFLLIACFAFHEISPFSSDQLFDLYTVIIVVLSVNYWICRADLPNPAFSVIFTSLSGTFFWMCLFTSIKFFPILPFVAFPVFGLMAAAPFLFTILAFSQTKRQVEHHQIPYAIVFGAGIIPIFLIYLMLELLVGNGHLFIELFKPVQHF